MPSTVAPPDPPGMVFYDIDEWKSSQAALQIVQSMLVLEPADRMTSDALTQTIVKALITE